jgi:penicillin-binding protein 2
MPKLYCFMAVVFICFLVIIGRLAYLQIINAHHLAIRAHQNFLRLETITSQRGDIVDCKGNLLATNKPVYHLYWHGSGNRNLTESQLADLEKLLNLMHIPMDDNVLKAITRAERMAKAYSLRTHLTHEQLCTVIELFAIHTNITIRTTFQRHYPYQNYASHIIGYLGNNQIEKQGRMGLEKLCDPVLRGMNGTLLNAINSWGQQIDSTLLEQPLTGQLVVTTLDMRIQEIAESVFPEDFVGALVIMDPLTGGLRAIVSRPTFDPTLFLSKISTTTWESLQENNTFLNRVFMFYPPGSLFKLVTTSAALEEDIINQQNSWYCRGYTTFGNRKYYCARKRGHGHLSLKQAVAESCNTLFFEIGKHLDIDVLADYAHRFGLGKKTGIVFQEQLGLVPTRQWKRAIKGQPWWPGETLSAVIGQTFLLASPLQIACFIGSIFTKKLVRPRILEDEHISSTPLNIKQETLDFLKKSMKSVVRRGTGKRITTIKDLEIFAKTSTAQISSLEKAKDNKNYLEHGWVATYFTYKGTRPLVMVLLVEKAGSSRVPTMIAKQFFLQYRQLMAQEESRTSKTTVG